MTPDTHNRLIAKQSTSELRRKQQKARQKGLWTQEDIDLADREAGELHAKLFPLATNHDGESHD